MGHGKRYPCAGKENQINWRRSSSGVSFVLSCIRSLFLDRRAYKGYLPVAIDGTDIHLPATAQTQAIFGDANTRSAYAAVMGSVSCAYDACNDLILDARLSRYKRSERASAQEHIARITNTFPQKCIFLFYRGYPSAEFLMELLDARQKFLFRLGGSTFKREQKTQKEADGWIEITLDQTRMNPHRGKPLAEKMRQTGSLETVVRT